MKYSSSSHVQKQKRIRKLKWFGLFALLLLLCGGAVVLSGAVLPDVKASISEIIPSRVDERVDEMLDVKVCNRLLRNQIPYKSMESINARRMFDDNNDIQLEAARKNGISNPYRTYNPQDDSMLVSIFSNNLYCVDKMDYSSPYLVKDAALLLQMLALRFNQIVEESGKAGGHSYRLIVTSALRTPSSVARLRRYNRNATDNSCHIYGTTTDVSYIRFLRDDNVVVNEIFLQQALAKAFYELRYEGLCYVKFERRQSCYHFTVRSVNYKGSKKHESVAYHELKPAACPTDLSYDELMLPKSDNDTVYEGHMAHLLRCLVDNACNEVVASQPGDVSEGPYVSDIFIYANK